MSSKLGPLERRILDIIQQDFPISTDPYAEIGEEVGCSAQEAYDSVQSMRESGIIRRIGGSFVPAKLGYVSALVAAQVEPAHLESAAAAASAFAEVTHNYERSNKYNLWFTIIAESEDRLNEIADSVRHTEGVKSLCPLPAIQTFKLRVQFNMEKPDA